MKLFSVGLTMLLVFSWGAVPIVDLPELFRDLANVRMLVFGADLILMMIFRGVGFFQPGRAGMT
jgi:ABC-type branched-subunit amino acid transport system permease subunit